MGRGLISLPVWHLCVLNWKRLVRTVTYSWVSINSRTLPELTPMYRTPSSPASAKGGPEGPAVHSPQALVLLETPGEPRLRTPALSCARVVINCWPAGRPASTATHTLTSLASLIMVTSAFYLPRCHKLSPFDQWPVQRTVFSPETSSQPSALGISDLHSAWISGLCHWGAPKLTHSFWDWLR